MLLDEHSWIYVGAVSQEQAMMLWNQETRGVILRLYTKVLRCSRLTLTHDFLRTLEYSIRNDASLSYFQIPTSCPKLSSHCL